MQGGNVLSKIIALLPMKANSERVPGKNFKLMAGKPLYRWVLDALLRIDEIDAVVINTDARNLLQDSGLVESDRVVIHERKQDLCGDMVSMNRIIEEDIKRFSADIYLMTHTTNPLLKAETIDAALQEYIKGVESGEADSLFTVNRIQTRFYKEDGSPVNHDPDNLVRTQDLELWYEENSNLYIFSSHSFSKTSARIGEKPMMHETVAIESIDIDDSDDWFIAESIAFRQGN